MEVADRLAAREARGTTQVGRADPCAAAATASSCAMLATSLRLGRSKALRVAAAAALPLGSGRRVLQRLAELTGNRIAQPEVFGQAGDQLDCLQMFMQLALGLGIAAEFAASVAPPEQVLGWLRDAARLLARLWPLERTGGPVLKAGDCHACAHFLPATAPAGGSMTSLLTSYASVMMDCLQVGAPYASIRTALEEPSLVQPLLLGLAEAPAALRGESSPLHEQEAWQLLAVVGTTLRELGCQGGDDACLRLLSSSTRPGGPALLELVRDAAAAMPRSRPEDVPLPNYQSALIYLCGTLGLLWSRSGGSSSGAGNAPPSDADWAAVEAFSMLAGGIRRLAAPLSQLSAGQVRQAAAAVQSANRGLCRLLGGVVASGDCTPRQLQLAAEAAWEAARQLPLPSAADPSRSDSGHFGKVAFCAVFLLLDRAGKQLAAQPPSVGAGGSPDSSAAAAEDALAACLQLLQQLHGHLCKAAHAMVASLPAEQQQAQAALVEAEGVPAQLLAECYATLLTAFDRCARSEAGSAARGDR